MALPQQLAETEIFVIITLMDCQEGSGGNSSGLFRPQNCFLYNILKLLHGCQRKDVTANSYCYN